MKLVHRLSLQISVLMFWCVSCLSIVAQQPQPTPDYGVKEHYTKTEVQITMRDGVKLFTAIYAPKDTTQKYPIMLSRTPYSVAPYGANEYKSFVGPSPLFTKEKYIFVYQDVRGKWESEGDYVNMRPFNPNKQGAKDVDEASDTFDTLEWLLKNVSNNNGRVGMWGISYPGFYTTMGILSAHPALKAASPQAPIADWFIGDDFHHNGAFFLPHAFNFYATFGHPRPKPTTQDFTRFDPGTQDGYKFFLAMGAAVNGDKKYFKGDVPFWNDVVQHPNYDDWWKARVPLPYLKNVNTAVMTVGGWFDAEDLYGALNTYKAIEKQNPGIYNTLVMGPWFHGGWSRGDGDFLGNVSFGEKTSVFYREHIELPFFNCKLKDKCEEKLPEAYVFETGANKWHALDVYPPQNTVSKPIYLHANNQLSFDAPGANENNFDEYVSDPSKPVPFINQVNIGMTREYMTDDQRFAAHRQDVLVYQTEPLAENVTIVGAITASMFVSTSGTDSDYIVKLIDVYPDDAKDNPHTTPGEHMSGYQMLVRGEPFRARFRNSYSKPEAMTPNEATKVEFNMPDAYHTFLKGHRIMVQVQSTWFPLVDRNPQKFVPNISEANDGDYQKATERVYHSAQNPSHIILNVMR
ncbi:MAG: CocE/NonD family hydrolase [Pyrinomonadaceae bacterium]